MLTVSTAFTITLWSDKLCLGQVEFTLEIKDTTSVEQMFFKKTREWKFPRMLHSMNLFCVGLNNCFKTWTEDVWSSFSSCSEKHYWKCKHLFPDRLLLHCYSNVAVIHRSVCIFNYSKSTGCTALHAFKSEQSVCKFYWHLSIAALEHEGHQKLSGKKKYQNLPASSPLGIKITGQILMSAQKHTSRWGI